MAAGSDVHPAGSFSDSWPLLPDGALLVSSTWTRTLLAVDEAATSGTIARRGETFTARAGTTASSRIT
jgi:hypothetical protein